MADLSDGESVEVSGSGSAMYTLKNDGGVFSCTCPAWRHQSLGIERRSCKHLKRYRGEEAEKERLGDAYKAGPVRRKSSGKSASGGKKTDGAPVLLAHKWKNDIDLSGWWVSEKLDGVRAYWDGKTFFSRLGNEFLAPAWFTEGFPDTPLDGELWVARQEFQKTVSIVRRHDRGEQWKQVKYVIFDAPSFDGLFEERVAYMKSLPAHPYISVLPHEPCRDEAHLREELARVEGLGGEGLMLREPKSAYHVGRSHSLLKVKTFHDAEAVVIDYVPGKGKHKGRTGALVMERPDGVRFNVGTGMSDRERENPPEVGAVVTYRFQELTKDGVPRFPSYVGVRVDVEMTAPSLAGGNVGGAPKPATRRVEAGNKDEALASIDAQIAELTIRLAELRERRFALATNAPAPGSNTPTTYPPARKPSRPKMAAQPKKEPPSAEQKAKAAAVAKASQKPTSTSWDCYVFEGGGSNKFWDIQVHGAAYTVRYGRVGTNGQTRTKQFASPAEATSAAEKITAKKVAKGYGAT